MDQTQSWAQLREEDDCSLMRHLTAGNHDALAVIVDRYQRLVLSVALRIVRNVNEAEDVVQSVFLDIFRKAGQFDPSRGTLKVWLLQYAYHRAFDRKQYLNRRNFYSQESIEDLGSFLHGESFTLGKYAPGELHRLLQQGLASLGEPQKQVIVLANYEGLSMKEIADKTGDSLANVRHHYYRGLQKLRSFIGQDKIRSKDE